MASDTICDLCGEIIVGAPAKGALAAHLRRCRQIVHEQAPADTEFIDRVLAEITSQNRPRHYATAAPTGDEDRELPCSIDPLAASAAPKQTTSEAELYEVSHVHREYEKENDCLPSSPMEDPTSGIHSEVPSEDHGFDTEEEPQGNPGQESDEDDTDPAFRRKPVFIERKLSYDDIIAWMLLDLSDANKKKIMLAMRLLAVLSGKGPEADPFYKSKIRTVEAFNKYLDDKAGKCFSQMIAREVPVVSKHEGLRDLPPLPIFIRSLPDVLACSVANPNIDNSQITLDPICIPEGDDRTSPDVIGRVATFMHGSIIQNAKQV